MNAQRRDRLRGGRHRRARAGAVAQATFPTFELQAAPRVSSGLTLPIGRVGALAVALGVGLAFGTGTAYAEDTSSTSETDKTESTKSSTSTSSESDSTSSERTATSSPDTDDDSDDTAPRPRPGVSSDPDISNFDDEEPADDDEPAEVDETDESASDEPETEEPAPDGVLPVTTPGSATDDPPEESSDDTDQSDPADTAAVPEPKTQVSGPRHSAETLSATTGSVAPRVVAGPPTTDTESPSLPALWSATADAPNTMVLGAAAAHAKAPNPIEVVVGAKISAVKTVLAVTQKILTVFFNPPGGTAQPGLLWVALAWVRREIEHTFFNRTPRVNDQEITLTLDPGGHSLPITLGATDREGDTLTYRVPTTGKHAPEHGTVTVDKATGTLVYTPTDPEYTGTDIFTVKVADRGFHLHGPLSWIFKRHHGHTDTAVITIHLRPDGTPTTTIRPVVTDDILTTAEDTRGTGNVLTNDGIQNNDGSPATGSLIASLAAGPTHGRVVLYDDGTYEYTPDADYHGTDSFTYTATTVGAGGGVSATATVTVIVTPVNDAPAGLPGQSGFGAEDTTFGGQLLAGDIDSPAAALGYAVSGQAQHGSVTINPAGTWSYTPHGDYTGTDSFTFTVTDGQDVSTPVTVSVIVTPVDDPPTGLPGQAGIGEEDTTFGGQLLAADIDSPAAVLRYALASQAAHGTVSVDADGGWTYTPDAGFHGADSFTFTVSDGTSTSAPALVSLTVTPVYDPPVGNPASASGDEDHDISGQLTGTGGDVGTLAYTLDASPAHGSVTLDAAGSWTYTPDQDFNGTDSFTFTVDDGRSISDPATVTITVRPVNDTPTAQAGAVTTTEDGGPVTGSLVFGDVDLDDTMPDQITVSVTQPAGGTVSIHPGGTGYTYTYTPNPDFSGVDTFTYSVTDAAGAQSTATITVTITAVNDRPVATPGLSGTVVEDAVDAVGGTLAGTDADADTLNYTLDVQAQHGFVAVDASTGTWTYTPDPDFHGTDTFMFTVNDGTLISAPAEVTVFVTAVNDAPVIGGDLSLTTDEDVELSIPRSTLPISDVDGDALAVSIGNPPAHGTIVIDPGGAFVYTPDADYHGVDSFTYTVSDGQGGTATASVSIAVASIPDAPVANPDAINTDEFGTTVTAADLLANDTDGDNDSLTAIIVTHPENGILFDNGDGTFTYIPDDGYSGPDSFTYMASDGSQVSPTTVVTITVASVL